MTTGSRRTSLQHWFAPDSPGAHDFAAPAARKGLAERRASRADRKCDDHVAGKFGFGLYLFAAAVTADHAQHLVMWRCLPSWHFIG